MDSFDTILNALDAARDAAMRSPHPVNRIGAALVHPENPSLMVAAHNDVPDVLARAGFDVDSRIGASSASVHAELSCAFTYTGDPRGGTLCLTDPFCPNCGKYLAELGISMVLIATDGLTGDFAQRRGDAFHSMSVLIARRAGMAVGLVDRLDRAIDWLVPPRLSMAAVSGGYATFAPMPLENAAPLLNQTTDQSTPWAAALVRQADGAQTGIVAYEALPPGMTPEDARTLRDPDLLGKYRFPLDPLTRLLLICRRHRWTLLDAAVATNLVPSSRALVNAVGFGITRILPEQHTFDHDPQGIEAFALLQHKGILLS